MTGEGAAAGPGSSEPASAEVAELRAAVRALEREVGRLRRELFPAADLHPSVRLGERVRIDPRVRLHSSDDAPIEFADDANVYRGAELFGPLVIGRGTFLNRDVYVKPGVTFGVRVAVGPFTRFLTEGHEIGVRASRAGRKTTLPITVEDGVWIGGDVTVLGGVTIGAGAVVASGALVNRDVPANAVVAGVPARVVRVIGAPAPAAGDAVDPAGGGAGGPAAAGPTATQGSEAAEAGLAPGRVRRWLSTRR